MTEQDQPISLGLSAAAPQPAALVEMVPAVESLQFRKAEHLPDPASGPQCAICKKSSGPAYFQVNGIATCPACAAEIEKGQQPAPRSKLLKAFLYGSGAALAGFVLYAAVAIITGLELALISILIGYMVARAIRHASGGGRPQQIMAVALTYFSISTSYVPVTIYHFAKEDSAEKTPTAATADKNGGAVTVRPEAGKPKQEASLGSALFGLFVGCGNSRHTGC